MDFKVSGRRGSRGQKKSNPKVSSAAKGRKRHPCPILPDHSFEIYMSSNDPAPTATAPAPTPAIKYYTTFQNTVADVLASRDGWREVSDDDPHGWDFVWADRDWYVHSTR